MIIKFLLVAFLGVVILGVVALMLYYYLGKEKIEQDHAEGVRWLQKSADQGHDDAQFFLFMAYNNGEGVEKDLEVAVAWLNKALAQGNEKAIEVAKKVKGL